MIDQSSLGFLLAGGFSPLLGRTEPGLNCGGMSSIGGYGYSGKLEEIRSTYGNLPRAYLDNAAAPLFPHTIPRLAADALCSMSLANPHSQTLQSTSTMQMADYVRAQVLEQLSCDPAEFDVVFCANATAAAKLVGEALHSRSYVYLQDSHTSLVGLRELAKSYNMCTNLESIRDWADDRVVSWPLQSNFDGRRYTESEDLIHEVHRKNGLVLLDIASYAATEMPNLGRLNPDFAVLSFYKIYGLPDLGALIVRKSPRTYEFFSHKRYFGGGTVAALTSGEHFFARKKSFVDFLEDGTVPFHSILVLKVAMEEFRRLYGSHRDIACHTKMVANYCKSKLSHIPGCRLIAPSDSPIVSFMLNDIGHNEFAMAAGLQDVHVRGGTLCNIGAFTGQFGSDDSTIIKNYETLGKTCNDEISFIDGKPTGVIRLSFGPYSSYEDVDVLLQVISGVISSAGTALPGKELSSSEPVARILALYTYPIKSCGGLSLKSSPLGAQGLKYDREFCLVDLSNNKVLSLKKYRTMAFLKPRVVESTLVVRCERFQEPLILHIPRESGSWSSQEIRDSFLVNTDPEVVKFFSRAVGIPCTIARQNQPTEKNIDGSILGTRTESSLANSSPLLVVGLQSAEALGLVDTTMFRPNLVVETKDAWVEDTWTKLAFPKATISMLGKCRRCNMVTVTENGESDSHTYLQLCKYRKQDGKIYFGQHAALVAQPGVESVVAVGDAGYEQ